MARVAFRVLAVVAIAATVGAPSAQAFTYRGDDDPVATQKIFDAGGLRLLASCHQNGAPGGTGDVQLWARSKVDGAMIHLAMQNGAGSGSLAGYGEDDFFNAGAADQFDFETDVYGGADATTDATGQVVYRTQGGRVVTVDFLTEDKGLPGGKECLVAGTSDTPRQHASSNVYYRALSGEAKLKRIFKGGGLKLKARCVNGPTLEVFAYGRSGDVLHVNSQSDANHDTLDEHGFHSDHAFLFGTMDPFLSDVADTDSAGQMIYTGGKTVVAIDYLAETNDVFDPDGCEFAATARVAGKGSSVRALYKRNADDGSVFLNHGGLKLRGSCGNSLDAFASNKRANTTVHSDAQGDFNEDGTDEKAYSEIDQYDGAPASIPFLSNLQFAGLHGQDNSSGHLIFASPDGHVASLDYLVDQDEALGKDCVIAGVEDVAG